jgi:hypothetical protein
MGEHLHTTKKWIKLEVIRCLNALSLMLGHGPGLLHFSLHKLSGYQVIRETDLLGMTS